MKYLVKKAQRGDKEAFVELMELYKQDLYKVAKSYLRCDEDAADAIQDAILSCYEHLKDLREIRCFKTWMIRILINKCKDILDKKESLLEAFLEQEDPHHYEQESEFEELMDMLDEKAANYVPKGYELKTEGAYEGKIHNDETGKGITIMLFNAANLDDMKTRDFSNVLNVEEMEIQNMETHVITYETMGKTLQDVLLFNEADGYCIDIWSNAEELRGEELKKVAENLQIRKLDTQIAYKTAQEKLREERWKEAEETRRSKSIPKELIRNIGMEMADPNFENLGYVEDIRYTVEAVRVLDAISFEEFPKENFDTETIEWMNTFEEEVKPWLNDDGTLKQHERYLAGKDGVNDSKENREMIGAKFVVVHMKANVAGGAKDTMEESDISVTLAPDMEFYETDENGNLTHAKEYTTPDEFAGNAGHPVYFETSSELKHDSNVKSVWHCNLDKGDVVEYTLIYIVDEDRLENAYLQFYMNGNFMEHGCTYVKVDE